MIADLLSLLPNLKEKTKQISDENLLTGQEWVLYDILETQKVVWFFRSNGNLEIFKNGIGLPRPGRWEYISNKGVKNSLITEVEDGRYLLKQAFFDDNFLMLTIDGSFNDYKIFLNQSKIPVELNSQKIISDYIMEKYIMPEIEKEKIAREIAEKEKKRREDEEAKERRKQDESHAEIRKQNELREDFLKSEKVRLLNSFSEELKQNGIQSYNEFVHKERRQKKILNKKFWNILDQFTENEKEILRSFNQLDNLENIFITYLNKLNIIWAWIALSVIILLFLIIYFSLKGII
jgi:hypothetical protein